MQPAKLGEVPLLGMLLLLLLGLCAFLIAGLLGAIFLRLASAWLGVGQLNFTSSIKVSLTTHFVQWMLTALGTFAVYLPLADPRPAVEGPRRLAEWWSPQVGLLSVTGLVLIHAVLYCLMLEEAEGEPVKFLPACGLALVYLAIYTAFLVCLFLGWSVALTLLAG
jgi:hypothetical protein